MFQVQFFSDLSDFNEYVNFLDHDGYPPTQTWVTDEILERRAAKKAEEEKAKAAGKDDSEKKDELWSVTRFIATKWQQESIDSFISSSMYHVYLWYLIKTYVIFACVIVASVSISDINVMSSLCTCRMVRCETTFPRLNYELC